MFFININLLWSFNFFFYYLYLLFLTSLIFYLLPNTLQYSNTYLYKTMNFFQFLSGFDLYWVVLTPLTLMWLNLFSWNSLSISAWFGHLVFSHFQYKITYLILIFFFILTVAHSSFFYLTSKDVYDYYVIIFNFLFWTIFFFYSNSLFTIIFFIEVLSTLILLLLLTSNFASSYFYENLNLNLHNYFQKTTPFFFVQALLFFFWISLVSSLNLFLFLILFYLKFLTFEWFLFEFVFYHLTTLNDFKSVFSIFFIWFNLLFCIFIKCGLVPFYFWKPVFFKGMPLHTLMFYICFFYFFIFLFFLHFLLVYTNEIFYYYLQVNVILLFSGFFILFFMLCESYYIKTFLASSSILNTLFIFLTASALNTIDVFFI